MRVIHELFPDGSERLAIDRIVCRYSNSSAIPPESGPYVLNHLNGVRWVQIDIC